MKKLTLDTPVKFLRSNLAAPIGVGSWIVGDWMPPIQGKLVPCVNGYHYTTIKHWRSHKSNRMFLIETGDEVIADDTKWVCREAKLTLEVVTWNQKNLSLFAADCVERVAHLNSDPRVMAAITAVRDFWANKIGKEELRAVYAAVYAAAYAAVDAAAAAAVDVAAYAAAYAAVDAAVDAAAYAAAYAADAAADAAYAAEREWQTNRLLQYLNGEV